MILAKKRIILSKINRLGDVTCCLPIATMLKKMAPDCHIIFLGQEYTRPLIEIYQDIDEFADWRKIYTGDENQAAVNLAALNADIIVHILRDPALGRVAKKAKIPLRIASASKLSNWLTCNRLVSIQRSKNQFNEAQYDMMFLKALGAKKYFTPEEIIPLRNYKSFPNTLDALNLLDKQRFNLILHPKGSDPKLEWPVAHFAALIKLLPADKFNIFITGTSKEADQIRAELIEPFPHVIDLGGTLTLAELMQFIAKADGIVCGSTGPVHLGANFGINTLGLYITTAPFFAKRWGPIGAKAESLSANQLSDISPEQVYEVTSRWYKAGHYAAKK